MGDVFNGKHSYFSSTKQRAVHFQDFLQNTLFLLSTHSTCFFMSSYDQNLPKEGLWPLLLARSRSSSLILTTWPPSLHVKQRVDSANLAVVP